MHQPLTIAVFAATTRTERKSIAAARYIGDIGQALDNIEIIFVDPLDFTFAGDGNDPEGKDSRYSDITARADAFFIVTPEYNHSFPGSLKRMLDSEFANYNHKPVAIAGVSNGNWGGVRAIQALVPTVRRMGMIPLSWDVYFPYIQNIFDDDGRIVDESSQSYQQSVTKLYSELIWFADVLKTARAAV